MTVVQICPYAWDRPGGVQTHVRGLTAELRRRGHDVQVLAPADRDTGDDGVVIVGRPLSIPYNGSVAPICPRPVAMARTASLVRALRPDVVHVHEPFSPGISMAGALAAAAPVVATFHASADTLWCYRAFAPLLRVVRQRLQQSIAVSDAAAALLAHDLGMHVDVLPNGIDTTSVLDGPIERPSSPTVLFVGRLEPRKGVRVLLDALPALVRQVPDVRVVVAGDGRDRDAIAALPPEVARRVSHLGVVSDRALRQCYATASVLAAPSLSRESFGIVLLEAMAAGVPVVASDIAGYRAVVRDGIDGRLVPPAQPEALAAALAETLRDHAATAPRIAAARDRAHRYSWACIADAIVARYGEALRGRQAGLTVAPARSVHTPERA